MPAAMRALRGGKGSKPKPGEVHLEARAPDPPPWISDHAREEWNHLVEILEPLQVLTVLECRSLWLLAEALADYRNAESASARDKAWRRAFGGLAEFGLTPSSRTRLQTRQLDTSEEKSDARSFMESA